MELLDTDKEGFETHIYDRWKKYGIVSISEEKLAKIYRQTKAFLYIVGNKPVKVIRYSYK